MSNSEGKDKGGSIKETKKETKNKDESDNQLGGAKKQDGPIDVWKKREKKRTRESEGGNWA